MVAGLYGTHRLEAAVNEVTGQIGKLEAAIKSAKDGRSRGDCS